MTPESSLHVLRVGGGIHVGIKVRAGILAVFSALLVPTGALAELRFLEILKREAVAGGLAFGAAGPYEKITAIGHYALDPGASRNEVIHDLALAPRDGTGLVEFEADVIILAPRDPARGNGSIFYDVANRGTQPAIFNFLDCPSLQDPCFPGNGFLFRRGYAVVWSGWEAEVVPGEGRVILRAPMPMERGKPIRGIVRYEAVPDALADSWPLAHRPNLGSYPPSAKSGAQAKLTWRLREEGERIPIPRNKWRIVREPLDRSGLGLPGQLPVLRLELAGGLKPGAIYEWIGEVEGPVVQGVGFAAVRDLVSFLRRNASDNNPLAVRGKPAVDRAYAFGMSQSGRFLREFLRLGMNADELGRKVFEGMIIHVAGGGLGYFNERFAQPTRNTVQHEEHLFPGDRYPFTYGDGVEDPFSGKREGLLHVLQAEDPRLVPLIFHTQTAAEYWSRSGSLVTTDPLGTRDVELPPTVRVYAFEAQHWVPVGRTFRYGTENLLNSADYHPFLRALLDDLDAWVKHGAPPPPSIYPRIADGNLVNVDAARRAFPPIPGVRFPEVIQRPPALDYGPEFESRGIITLEPPRRRGDYVVLVPKPGPDGTERGLLDPPEVAVPLATFTGWNLRNREIGAEGMLRALVGSTIPFARTRAQREASKDPRASVEERYASFAAYRDAFNAACAALVQRRLLLPEDVERLQTKGNEARPLFGR